MQLTTVAAVLASVTGLLRSWPQVVLILRRRDATGVSATSWTLSLATCVVWLVLGIALAIPATITYNLLLIPGAGAVLALLIWQRQAPPVPILVGTAASVLVSVLVTLRWGEAGIAVLGCVLSASMFVPQAVKVLRGPADGVSRASWVLTLVSSGSWLWYGLMLGEPALIATPLLVAPTGLVILWRAHSVRRATTPLRRALTAASADPARSEQV